MFTRQERLTYSMLFLTGAMIEVIISMATGARESWDTDIYWSVGLPAMITANGIAGYFGEGKSILHGISIVAGQLTAMMVIAGEIGSLVVPGIILSLVLGTIVSIGSYAGKSLRNYFTNA